VTSYLVCFPIFPLENPYHGTYVTKLNGGSDMAELRTSNGAKPVSDRGSHKKTKLKETGS